MATYACIKPTGYTLSGAETTRYSTREYTSQAAFEAGEGGDWTATGNTDTIRGEIIPGDATYNWDSTPDTTSVTYSGWTLDATYNLVVTALTGARNPFSSGGYSTAYYTLDVGTSDVCINIDNASDFYAQFDGLQMKTSSTSDFNSRIFRVVNQIGYLEISNCWMESGQTSTSAPRGMYIAVGSTGQTIKLWNCAIDGSRYGFTNEDTGLEVYHCLITDAGNRGFDNGNQSGTQFINNVVFNTANDINNPTGATINYCALDDADGTNRIALNENASGEWTASFTDYTTGDYHVKDASSLLYDAGTAISAWTTLSGDTDPLSTDIAGNTRTTNDVGPFAFVSASGISIPVVVNHLRNQGAL